MGYLIYRARHRFLAGVQDATGPSRQVLVDLSGVTFLAEAGLRVLLDAHRRLSACGGELILAGAGVRIRRLLQLTRDDRVLHLQPADLRREMVITRRCTACIVASWRRNHAGRPPQRTCGRVHMTRGENRVWIVLSQAIAEVNRDGHDWLGGTRHRTWHGL